MIELIFAIAVIGITLMSVPNLTSMSSKTTYVALQQESVTMLSSQLASIMTAQWDQKDTNDSIGYPVLQTDSSTIPACTTALPLGVSDNDGRYCRALDDKYYQASSTLGADANDANTGSNDIDDFDNTTTEATVYNSEEIKTYQGNYIDVNISIKTNIWYGDDKPHKSNGSATTYKQQTTFSNPFDRKITDGTTRNIKLIRARLTSHNPSKEIADKNITMGAFMCNIGASKAIYWKAY